MLAYRLMKENKPTTTVKPTIFNIKTKSIPLPNSTSNPRASGVITSSMASLVKRGICTLTIVPTSMQATLTRKSGQLFEIYRQIRAKVPIHANTHFTRYACMHAEEKVMAHTYCAKGSGMKSQKSWLDQY